MREAIRRIGILLLVLLGYPICIMGPVVLVVWVLSTVIYGLPTAGMWQDYLLVLGGSAAVTAFDVWWLANRNFGSSPNGSDPRDNSDMY